MILSNEITAKNHYKLINRIRTSMKVYKYSANRKRSKPAQCLPIRKHFFYQLKTYWNPSFGRFLTRQHYNATRWTWIFGIYLQAKYSNMVLYAILRELNAVVRNSFRICRDAVEVIDVDYWKQIRRWRRWWTRSIDNIFTWLKSYFWHCHTFIWEAHNAWCRWRQYYRGWLTQQTCPQ